jgi:hypothetical protein
LGFQFPVFGFRFLKDRDQKYRGQGSVAGDQQFRVIPGQEELPRRRDKLRLPKWREALGLSPPSGCFPALPGDFSEGFFRFGYLPDFE